MPRRSLIPLVLCALLAGACGLDKLEALKAEAEKQAEPPPAHEEKPPPVVADGFTVVEVVPAVGQPKGLELVELHGGGFRSGARVYFGGSASPDVTVTSAGLIQALTPPHSAGLVRVRVENTDGTYAELDGAYLYYEPAEITSVIPSEGPSTGGTPVEIRGVGLQGASVVLFGGRAAIEVTPVDDRTIYAVLPAGTVGQADVHVVTSGGTARLRRGFRYFAPPQVSGFAPMVATPSGGGTLSIVGTGLTDGVTVAVGGAPAELLAFVPDGSKVVVRIPPGDTGSATLAVSTSHGASVHPGAFTYVAPSALSSPALLSVWPASGPASGGGEVMLVATGIDSANGLSVQVGGATAAVVDANPGQHVVLAVAPPGVAGQQADVVLRLANGQELVLPSAYRYDPTLRIDAVSPASGTASGGTAVAIAGEGFGAPDLEVFVGALPATSVEAVNDGTLYIITPPGSPGLADVRVRSGQLEATLPEAFTFLAGEAALWAVVPAAGAVAGNTWVTLFGADLPQTIDVLFGGVPATDVQRLSPTTAVARSPRSEDVLAVDVEISDGGATHLIAQEAFTYFDPTARWGGTWGDPIEGSINVTVLDAQTNDPLEGAVVIVGHDDPPQLKGYTDERGQVTLSGPRLVGRLEVTAARADTSASTILDFDAENVTHLLSLIVPSDPGPPGGDDEIPLEPGAVAGTVHGIGKYLKVPPGPCSEVVGPPGGACAPCAVDADCSPDAPHCTVAAGQPPFCASECAQAGDCTDGFECALAGLGQRCVPSPGTRQVRCFVSNPSLFSADPVTGEENLIDIAADSPTFALTGIRLGELAVYCLGGVERTVDGAAEFHPFVMGVARHVTVLPGKDANGLPVDATAVDVTLDIPLERSVGLVVEDPPLTPQGPSITVVRAWLDLGSDGVIPLGNRTIDPGQRELRFEGLPRTLTDVLYDAVYAFYAGALSTAPDTLPSSEVLRSRLGTLDDGAWLHEAAGAWSAEKTGYPGDIEDALARSGKDVFAVTHEGGVIHYDGKAWTAQGVAPGPPLRAVQDDLAGGVVVVGDAGRVLRWNGSGWAADISGTKADLRDVVAIGPNAEVAVGRYSLLEWDGSAWTPVPFGPPKDLFAASRAGPGEVVAVGGSGVLLRRSAGAAWKAVTVPFYDDLYGVAGTSAGLVVAVGAHGGVALGSADGTFTTMQAPTTRTLRDVVIRAADDVIAVGDAATVVRFDGGDWTLVSQQTIEATLRTVTAAGTEVFALGSHAVHLGPFVTVPTFSSPVPDGPWDRARFTWAAPGGAEPSFHALRLYGQTGAVAWATMAPGWTTSFQLPNLLPEGIANPPPGPKTVIGYRVQHPSFDIDSFDNRAFRLTDWSAWALYRFAFDTGMAGDAGVSLP